MAALDYLDVPTTATLLTSHPSSRLRPAPRISTNLPSTSPPSSPTLLDTTFTASPSREQRRERQRTNSATSPLLSTFSQFLFSAALPSAGLASSSSTVPPDGGGQHGVSGTATTSTTTRKKTTAVQLLSTKDSLSLPIMSANFKRFVTCVGPVFWVQDRLEEVLLWKKGWRLTLTWLAVYAFFCYFPQLLLCIPHIALIAIILATSVPGSGGPLSGAAATPIMVDQPFPPTAEGSVPWQANLQAIQNLMGALSDLSDLVKPYTFHLRLTPAHILPADSLPEVPSPPNSGQSAPPPPPPPSRQTSVAAAGPVTTSTAVSSSPSSNTTMGTSVVEVDTTYPGVTLDTRTSSPYTIHILTLLILTLPPLAYIVSLPQFPLRLAAFLAGALPILGLHPWARNELMPVLAVAISCTWNRPVPEPVLDMLRRGRSWVRCCGRWVNEWLLHHHQHHREADENDELKSSQYAVLNSIVQRVVDNDRLSDECWKSEMREVELWENERYIGLLTSLAESTSGSSGAGMNRLASKSSMGSIASFASLGSSLGSLGSSIGGGGGSSPPKSKGGARGKGSWSKFNLRLYERDPWTRRRDGWNGGGEDEDGAVDSRLTFPLAPGWYFVETEDWRKDVAAEWAASECGGGDEDGWVYTNDMWQDLQPSPFGRPVERGEGKTGGDEGGGRGPYVTRRRRWVRRIWYDSKAARAYQE